MPKVSNLHSAYQNNRANDSDNDLAKRRNKRPRWRMKMPELSNDEESKDDSTQKDTAAIWRYLKKFKVKECMFYKRKYDDNEKCYCGALEREHYFRKQPPAARPSSPILKPASTVPPVLVQSPPPFKSAEKDDIWREKEAFKEIPLNACGQITFGPTVNRVGGVKPAKYLRLSNDTSMTMVLRYLKDYVGLGQPSLVINVLGGVKNDKFVGKPKETFKRGLIRCVKSTSAWIITGGVHAGIMDSVGEAVKEGQTLSWSGSNMQQSMCCIGIAPWGYIHNFNELVCDALYQKDHRKILSRSRDVSPVNGYVPPAVDGDTDGDSFTHVDLDEEMINHMDKPVHREMVKTEKDKNVSLQPDHTHFLLVDDGYRNQFKSSHIADFQASLQKKLVEDKVPVLLILVDGGHGTIDFIKRSVEHNIPVVICNRTGRAANVLAWAYQRATPLQPNGQPNLNNDMLAALSRQVDETFGKFFKHPNPHQKMTDDERRMECEKVRDKIHTIVTTYHNILTIYDLNEEDDFDKCILRALLKTQPSINETLQLCFKWNRDDIAEGIMKEHKITPDINARLMKDALINNKLNFVKLILQENDNFSVHRFLTAERLQELYNNEESFRESDALVCKIIAKNERFANIRRKHKRRYVIERGRRVDVTLDDVAVLMKYFKFESVDEKFNDELSDDCEEYEEDDEDEMISEAERRRRSRAVDDFGESRSSRRRHRHLPFSHQREEEREIEPTRTFRKPFEQLFIYSILMNRFDMALFFWQHLDEGIAALLASSNIFKQLEKVTDVHDFELKEQFQKQKVKCQEMAANIVQECFHHNRDLTITLVERQGASWGGRTCLELGALCNAQNFLATDCCQNSIDAAWKQGISNNAIVIILTWFFPFLVATPIIKLDGVFRKSAIPDNNDDNDGDSDKVSVVDKVKAVYNAPVTKFWSSILCSLFFLVFLTWFLLFEYSQTLFTAWEAAVTFCVLMFGVDAGVSIMRKSKHTQRMELRRTFTVWNAFDTFAVAFFHVGLLIRIVWLETVDVTAFAEGRASYAVTRVAALPKQLYSFYLLLFYIRHLRAVSVSPSLGPKLFMIMDMLKELMLYLVILVICILAFGMTRISMMYDNQAITSERLYGENGFNFLLSELRAAVEHPFWHLFEPNILSPREEAGCMDANQTMTADGMPCPTDHFFLQILLGLYTLIGNILLINLLIAIFTKIYEKVQVDSLTIWKFSRYTLLVDYEKRPTLPPPLNFFYYVGFFICWCLSCCCSRLRCRFFCCRGETQQQVTLSQKGVVQLRQFERDMVDKWHRQQSYNEQSKVDQRIKAIQGKVEELGEMTKKISLSSLHPSAGSGGATSAKQDGDDNKQPEARVSRKWSNILNKVMQQKKELLGASAGSSLQMPERDIRSVSHQQTNKDDGLSLMERMRQAADDCHRAKTGTESHSAEIGLASLEEVRRGDEEGGNTTASATKADVIDVVTAAHDDMTNEVRAIRKRLHYVNEHVTDLRKELFAGIDDIRQQLRQHRPRPNHPVSAVAVTVPSAHDNAIDEDTATQPLLLDSKQRPDSAAVPINQNESDNESQTSHKKKKKKEKTKKEKVKKSKKSRKTDEDLVMGSGQRQGQMEGQNDSFPLAPLHIERRHHHQRQTEEQQQGQVPAWKNIVDKHGWIHPEPAEGAAGAGQRPAPKKSWLFDELGNKDQDY